jgi:uracil-DNA glycosylase
MTHDLWFGTSGPRNADIVIVGESWGEEEEQAQRPFVGSSGKELDRMLLESGHPRPLIFCTNMVAAKPPRDGKELETALLFEPNEKGKPKWRGLHPSPYVRSEIERLWDQLRQIRPRLVIAAGNWPLWALSSEETSNIVSISSSQMETSASRLVPGGIISWRGSMLKSNEASGNLNLLPLIHPAAILRAWYLRAVTVHDLKTRVKQALLSDWYDKLKVEILAPPTIEQAELYFCLWLNRANQGERIRVVCDIETARGLMTCIGFGTQDFGMTIPFVRLLPGRRFDSYWKPNEEAHLAHLIRKLLLHRNILIEGQNFLYDTQYIQYFLGIFPRTDFDTMLAHHLLFPGTPKGLDYLSSLYCRYHRYWKDDNKEWDLGDDETVHLRYNAEDLWRTFECATILRKMIVDLGQSEQWEWERRKAALALRMMNRGIRIDTKRRSQYGFELSAALADVQQRLTTIIPKQLTESLVKSSKRPWYSSPKQQQILFYDRLGLPSQRNRKTGSTTVDDEALENLKAKYPELSGLFDLILTARSIGVFHNTFVNAELEPDNRMKCSFNPAGTETFRWSSSQNAFRRGTNLQNIPKGDEE